MQLREPVFTDILIGQKYLQVEDKNKKFNN